MGRRLVSLLLFTVATSGAAQQQVREIRVERPPLAERYIVEFYATPAALAAPGTSANAHDALFDRFERDLRGGVTASASGSRRVLREFRTAIVAAVVEMHPATADRVRRLPYVRTVRADQIARALRSQQPIASTTELDPRSRVNAAGFGDGDGIVVAVIDTGIDYTHPALGGGFGPGYKVVGGYDFVNDDHDPMDDEGHGTHVAGIIAASSAELSGVAPAATLLAYKVLDEKGNGPFSAVIAAIERALDPDADGDPDDRADIINLSLGAPGDADDPVSRAVDNAVAAGVVVIVAAGNAGGISTVASPGVARKAITVAAIDDEDRVAGFSSRGPSSRSLAFKPDIAAGGDQVLSTLPKATYARLSGTSMAAPHVAGVAALLLERHPDWTPDRIKAALTGTAASVNAPPFARGAGKVDTRAADAATLTASVSGLSFGIRPSRSGVASATQTVLLTNHSSVPQVLAISSTGAPAGATLSFSSTSLTIPAGGAAELSVELTTANDVLEFPAGWLLGGDIEIQGTSKIRIPWGILRASRATVSFDGIMTMVVATDSKGGHSPTAVTPEGVEIFLPSGSTFDFMVNGWDRVAEGEPLTTQRTVVRTGVPIDGDHRIDLRASEATLEIRARGRDENGVLLSARSSSTENSLHLVGTRVMRIEDDLSFSLGLLDRVSEVEAFWFSPLPDNYRIHLLERYIDGEQRAVYSVEHPVLEGLDATIEVAGGGEELLPARIAPALPARGAADSVGICFHEALTALFFSIASESCFAEVLADGPAIRYYVTPEKFPWAHSGLVLRQAAVATQALRGRGDRVVMSSEEAPSPVASVLQPDELFAMTDGLAHPFALAGSKRGSWFRPPMGGYYGSGGESLTSREGVEWITFDSSGQQSAIGSFRDGSGVLPPLPAAGSRFVAVRNDLPVGIRRSRGTLDVRFADSEADLDAPTLTSLRLVDGSGRRLTEIAAGEQGGLLFSIADLDYAAAATSRESRPELTRVFWRRSATRGEWSQLPVRITGSDPGSTRTLKRYPAGDIYEAAIPSVSAADTGWYDVRVTFEDAAGNRVEWTQEFAITVGDPVIQPRHRGARR